MTTWTNRITADFHPEFASLWVVSDPDEILLTPQVSHVLGQRGIEIIPYRDPLAFRLLYETEIRGAAESRKSIIHVRGNASQIVPWDVLERARRVSMSIPELFGELDPSAVRSIGTEHYDDLWAVMQSRHAKSTMGVAATKDFLLTHLYRLVPSLVRRVEDFWDACFDLFFRGETLPAPLAQHVAEIATLPLGLRKQEAVLLLSDRAVFLDRVQRDWDRFALATQTGTPIDEDVIPFSIVRIRNSIDSMVLDGVIRPTSVAALPASVPAWVRIGMVQDETQAQELALRRLEALSSDIPSEGADFRAWLRFAERQAEVIDEWHQAPKPLPHWSEQVQDLLELSDAAFFSWLQREYDTISSSSYAASPSIVHHVAPYLSHLRSLGERLQALVVMDGLAIDQWLVVERHLKARRPDLLVDVRACFAWLPTLTGVSRQSIFTGDQPRAFPKTIGNTSAEAAAWKRFWVNEGLSDKDVFYARSLGQAGSSQEVVVGPVADRVPVVGIVVDSIDRILHGEIMGKRGIARRIDEWLSLGELDVLIDGLVDSGYQVYITSDHGNVDLTGIGIPAEGALAEERGERVRIYGDVAVRQRSHASIPGTRVFQPRGLPDDYLPLFAPYGAGFLHSGKTAISHGGSSIEELVVPFVRVSKKVVP
jgi:hypothetical protein